MNDVPRSISQQLATIRRDILRNGETLVRWEQLQLLCSDHLSVSQQFHCIADLARREKWSFAFFPDRTLRFASLEEWQVGPAAAVR